MMFEFHSFPWMQNDNNNNKNHNNIRSNQHTSTMSARAIRKLQGNNVLAQLAGGGDDEDDDDDSSLDDDDHVNVSSAKPKVNAFALMSHDDDDDDSSSSEEEVKENDTNVQDVSNNKEETPVEVEALAEDLDDILKEFKERDHEAGHAMNDGGVDTTNNKNKKSNDTCFASLLMQGLDVRDLDMDYTMRNALLQDPLGDAQQQNQQRNSSGSRNSSRTSSFLFGSPRDDWKQNRPPNFIGGGMCMICYDDDKNNNNATAASASNCSNSKRFQPPWPYPGSDDANGDSDYDHYCWFTFRLGDALQRDVHDYQELIVAQGAGNVNALLLFVAHHAYIPSALLQVSTVLYQTNHNVEALSMLKRCLFIYECARLHKFTKHLTDNTAMTTALLDHTLPENAPFFEALVQLMRVCTNAGLYKSTFAITRYILSLDPLRDPMGMLLVLDSFALHQIMNNIMMMMTTTATHIGQDCTHPAVSLLEWFIGLCESSKDLQVWYRDPDDANLCYQCDLLNMPNWAYSHAVALYQMSLLVVDDNNGNASNDDEDLSPSWQDRANQALQQAMRAHPTVVGNLLLACEVDTTGRSFQRNWPNVLGKATDAAQRLVHAHFNKCTTADETIVVTATLQAVDKVISIYTKVAAKTWCQGGGNTSNNDNERRNDLFQWLHDNLVEAMQEEERISNLKQPPRTDTSKNDKDEDNANDNDKKEQSTTIAAAAQLDYNDDSSTPPRLYPALMRYAKFHLSDFISSVAVLQLPGDVMNAQDNIIDPGMLAHAMVIDPRRPRFRRFIGRQRGGGGLGGGGQEHFDDDDGAWFAELQQQQRLFQQFGGPPGGIVDPDLPAMEVFWRSFLPWNHVDGVPPPPPGPL
jgi:Transcriptional repressor TCF25